MTDMIIGITTLKKLEELIRKAKQDGGFTRDAEVFINCNDDLAITFCDGKGYRGYFLNFKTGEIQYLD